MPSILLIESSLFPGEMSASRAVAAALAGDASVVRRDLASDPLPHASLDLMSGWMTPSGDRSAAQAEAVALSGQLIDELLAADIVVIGVPMYNFSIPSTLKAWIDHIAIAGQTFRYNEQGRPEGLVSGKRVILLASRGGIYGEGPMAGFNHQDPYLRAVLGFLGMTDLTVIGIEGQKMAPEQAAENRASAVRKLEDLLATAGAGVAA